MEFMLYRYTAWSDTSRDVLLIKMFGNKVQRNVAVARCSDRIVGALELCLACTNLFRLNEGSEMGGVPVVRVEKTKHVCCVLV